MRDLVVVGGGPAGLATAILAAREGFSVTLVERRRFPVDKPCGEGLMPEGVRLLEAMGVRAPRSQPLEGIRYLDGNLRVEARFRGGHGLGIRRTVLSAALVARARELGVEVLEASRAESVSPLGDRVRVRIGTDDLEGRWLAAADGLKSAVRREQGLGPPLPRGRRRHGFRRHYRTRPWSSFVEVYWGDGAEAYVTPVGEEEVGVAFLWHERASSWDDMLARFPALAERIEGLEPTSSLAGAGPLRRRVRRVTSGPIALVGDASGYVDAITGEGVALAFDRASALVASLKEGSLASYERSHLRGTRSYRTLTTLLVGLAVRPRLRRMVLAGLARRPGWFERLLSVSLDPLPTSKQIAPVSRVS